jgi:hypothetical protein
VKILRCLLFTLCAISLAACHSSQRKPKSQAKIYEGDTTPGISMHDEAPGTPLGQ